ncbi:peptidylprolyl isomerase [Pseudotabrizicola sp. L79]|uniref:peptidylprolyl isomerase n=1 Tax=Pseudotabrizicola sp. L79 TaxID=3118402 RepID=UPI002F9323B7
MTQRSISNANRKGRARAGLKTLSVAAFVGLAAMTAGTSVLAQQGSPFSTVLKINDAVITQYELDQRIRFLTLLRIPGDPVESAMKGLTNDRLAAIEAKRVNLRLTNEQIEAGMSEFAARANLSAEQFVAAISEGGVAAESFRDFVANGLLWRELVRAKYGSSISITEAEIDRAIATGTRRLDMQLLLSEIVIPVEGDPSNALALANQLRRDITTEAGFASAARRYSASPSAGRGGRMDWVPTSEIPAQLVQLVLALGPGQVSPPVQLPNAVAVFQLRDVIEDTTAKPPAVSVEYAQLMLPNTPSVFAEAETLANRIDSCKDLAAEARGLPQDRFVTEKKPVAAVPQDIALELAQLDPGEYSAALTRGGYRVFLMLCAREPQLESEGQAINRDAVRAQLQSLELEAQAGVWLEELRSEAIITTP